MFDRIFDMIGKYKLENSDFYIFFKKEYKKNTKRIQKQKYRKNFPLPLDYNFFHRISRKF